MDENSLAHTTQFVLLHLWNKLIEALKTIFTNESSFLCIKTNLKPLSINIVVATSLRFYRKNFPIWVNIENNILTKVYLKVNIYEILVFI